MTTLALPRIKTRRRKIKPPHPYWWFVLAFLIFSMVWLARDLIVATAPHEIVYATGEAFFIYAAWPVVKCPYNPPLMNTNVMLTGIAIGLAGSVMDIVGA